MANTLILSLETSTKVCSAALHHDNQLLAQTSIHVDKSHSHAITIMIDNLLRYTGYQMEDLSAVAVGKGPGSYTGLRIGVATAKGLCFAHDLPLISVSSLEGMAWYANQYNTEKYLLCPMIDARRMEVYCAIYDADMNLITPVKAEIINDRSFEEHLTTSNVLFFGDGAAKCRDTILDKNSRWIEHQHPTATGIGAIAYEKWLKDDTEDLVSFEPHYLKEFLVKKQKKNLLKRS